MQLKVCSKNVPFQDFNLHMCTQTVVPFGLGLNALWKRNVRTLLRIFLNLSVRVATDI